jgi:hypothetical protein
MALVEDDQTEAIAPAFEVDVGRVVGADGEWVDRVFTAAEQADGAAERVLELPEPLVEQVDGGRDDDRGSSGLGDGEQGEKGLAGAGGQDDDAATAVVPPGFEPFELMREGIARTVDVPGDFFVAASVILERWRLWRCSTMRAVVAGLARWLLVRLSKRTPGRAARTSGSPPLRRRVPPSNLSVMGPMRSCYEGHGAGATPTVTQVGRARDAVPSQGPRHPCDSHFTPGWPPGSPRVGLPPVEAGVERVQFVHPVSILSWTPTLSLPRCGTVLLTGECTGWAVGCQTEGTAAEANGFGMGNQPLDGRGSACEHGALRPRQSDPGGAICGIPVASGCCSMTPAASARRSVSNRFRFVTTLPAMRVEDAERVGGWVVVTAAAAKPSTGPAVRTTPLGCGQAQGRPTLRKSPPLRRTSATAPGRTTTTPVLCTRLPTRVRLTRAGVFAQQ